MGHILPFVAKVQASGDWTNAERARLQELGDRLAALGIHVDVVFGATDAGDPWCVVKDEHEEVLVHVARIEGQFVVHYAVEDALRQGADLHSALGERLDAGREDVVAPFVGRDAQTLLALIVAAAFFYETADAVQPAKIATGPDHLPSPDATPSAPALPDDLGPSQKRELAAHETAPSTGTDPETGAVSGAWSAHAEAPAATVVSGALAQEARPPTPPPMRALIFEAATRETSHVMVARAGEPIVGGLGPDALAGGGGDDRIELGPQVVANGGSGADTFIVQSPVVMDQPNTLLGVVVDFHPAEGDRLVDAKGRPAVVVTTQTAPETLARHVPGTAQPLVQAKKVEVDLDGDGKADGHLILGGGVGPAPEAPAPLHPVYPLSQEPVVVVTGQALAHHAFE